MKKSYHVKVADLTFYDNAPDKSSKEFTGSFKTQKKAQQAITAWKPKGILSFSYSIKRAYTNNLV